MKNFSSVANDLTKKFILAKNKKSMLNKIIYDVNYLVYSDTKEPLSFKAKSAILQHIFEVLAGRRELILNEGEQITPNFEDIILFFERRSFILMQLKTGIKFREELN